MQTRKMLSAADYGYGLNRAGVRAGTCSKAQRDNLNSFECSSRTEKQDDRRRHEVRLSTRL